MNKQEFMRTKPILPLLLSMGVPMMISMLIQSLYNIVDSIYVSRLGTDAITAISLVYPLQNVIMAVSVGGRCRHRLSHFDESGSRRSGESRQGGVSGYVF